MALHLLLSTTYLLFADPDDVAAMPISLDRRSIRSATELLARFNSSRSLSTAVSEIQAKNGYSLQKKDTRRRRKRKPRYPKNFNPQNPGPLPDPERWLPKYERYKMYPPTDWFLFVTEQHLRRHDVEISKHFAEHKAFPIRQQLKSVWERKVRHFSILLSSSHIM